MPERNLDFDTVINRKNTDCLKYDFAVRRGLPEDVLPLWIADMDFRTSSYIEDALTNRAKHGIFGYSEVKTPYFSAVHDWLKIHHGWETQEKWLVKTPGVVFALAMAVKAFTKKGDGVLIQQPVYYPFSEVIEDNGRRIVSNDLVYGDDDRRQFRGLGSLFVDALYHGLAGNIAQWFSRQARRCIARWDDAYKFHSLSSNTACRIVSIVSCPSTISMVILKTYSGRSYSWMRDAGSLTASFSVVTRGQPAAAAWSAI